MSDTHSDTTAVSRGGSPDGIETMHDVFSDWERRAILYRLQESDGPTGVDDVAAHVVGWRRGGDSPAPADDAAVERARRRIVYAHLLKMDEFGVVAYDGREETVRLSDEMQVAVSEPWTEDDARTAVTADAPTTQ